MRRVIPAGFACLVLSLVLSLAPERAARAASIEEAVSCALRSLPPSAHGGLKLAWRSAKGETIEIHGKYWAEQPSDAGRRVVISSAGAAKPAAYLFREGDAVGEAWLWTPDQAAPRQIQTTGAQGELFGTDLSLEDFARTARISFPGQLRRLDDAVFEGRAVYVVETRPAPDSGSAYQRIVTSVDKERCVVLRRECYEADFEAGAKPRKVLSVDPKDVKTEKGFARATTALLRDFRDGSETRFELVDLELEAKLPDGFFKPENLSETAK